MTEAPPTTIDTDAAWFQGFADSHEWTFAKTMAETPHEYVVRGRTSDPDTFEKAVRMVRRYGEPGKFHRRTLIYWVLNGYRYWDMSEPIEETLILNRAKADEVYGKQDAPSTASDYESVYDVLAPDYDRRYATPECEAENLDVLDLLLEVWRPDDHTPDVLDLGAGTGLLLDLNVTDPRYYTAVDPSQGMLNQLIIKHPGVTDLHPEPAERFLTRQIDDTWDLVAATFGVGSYLELSTVDRLPGLIDPGGALLLMFYEPGYAPSYYQDPPLDLWARRHGHALEFASSLKGYAEVEQIGAYTTVVWRRPE